MNINGNRGPNLSILIPLAVYFDYASDRPAHLLLKRYDLRAGAPPTLNLGVSDGHHTIALGNAGYTANAHWQEGRPALAQTADIPTREIHRRLDVVQSFCAESYGQRMLCLVNREHDEVGDEQQLSGSCSAIDKTGVLVNANP